MQLLVVLLDIFKVFLNFVLSPYRLLVAQLAVATLHLTLVQRVVQGLPQLIRLLTLLMTHALSVCEAAVRRVQLRIVQSVSRHHGGPRLCGNGQHLACVEYVALRPNHLSRNTQIRHVIIDVASRALWRVEFKLRWGR